MTDLFSKRICALLVLGAALMRVWMILEWPQAISGTDAAQYISLARNIVEGRGYSLWSSTPFDPDVYRSPGYPLFLAMLFKLGISEIGILAGQVILDIVSLFAGAALVSKMMGRRAGQIALIMGLFCPFTAAIPCLFLSESLAMPLITFLFVLAPLATRWHGAVLFGFVLGLLILTRGGFLPSVALAGLFLLLPVTCSGNTSWFRRLGLSGAMAVTASIVLLPYGFWNLHTHGSFSVTPLAGMGRALWGGVAMMPGMPALPPPEPAWSVHNSIWGDGTVKPGPAELIAADNAMKDVAVDAIRLHPFRYLNGAARHALHIWFGERYLFPFNNPVIPGFWLRLGSSLLLALALGSLITLPSPPGVKALMVLPALTLALTHPWLYVNMRYTSTALGPIVLLAGAGVHVLITRISQQSLFRRKS